MGENSSLGCMILSCGFFVFNGVLVNVFLALEKAM